jgi:nitrogen-specific signal transduction histidine kinase
MKLIKSAQMKLYLFLTILVMAILPLLGSFYLLDDVLEGTLNLGLNPQMGKILDESQQDLKELRKGHPEQEEALKERFYSIQEQKQIFEDTEDLKNKLKKTYQTYYFIGVLISSFFALIAALTLGSKISRSYGRLLLENQKKNQMLQELENFDQWKRMAKKLAHEIKNPLTPIEMMVSALTSSFERKDRRILIPAY